MLGTGLASLTALAGLVLLSIEDLRRREVNDKHVLLLAVVTGIVSLLEKPWNMASMLPVKMYIVLNVILLAGVALAAAMGTLGWGDVAALIIMLIAAPTTPRADAVLPTLMTVLFYYLVAMGAYVVYNLLLNLATAREKLSNIPSPRIRIVYALIARPRKVKLLMEKPGWWYPLNLCGDYKIRFNIYLDPPDIAKEVKRAVRKGCVKANDEIWATYGIPAIPLLTAAFALSLILGDKPLLMILGLNMYTR
jgi:preflagellin peptidase FlaK